MKQNNNKLVLYFYFGVIISFFVVLSALRIFYAKNYLVDTYEHIHASWLVSTGLVPYRDFFEHHHPLLWYLFAPVTQLFYRNANIVYIARLIAVLGYFLTLYLTYNIAKNYNKSEIGGIIAILFLFCFSSLWLDIQNLRPDIFMYISILAAIKCFFDYLDKHQLKYLCFSYFLWLVAFLFLQKAILVGFGFALVNIWLIYKKQLSLNNIAKASIIPLVLISMLIFLLYYNNLWQDYYNCNFNFNLLMKKHFGNYSSGLHNLPLFALAIFLAITRFYVPSYKGSILIGIYVMLGISLLKFAPHTQYYFFFFVLSAILLSPILSQFYLKKNFLYLVINTVFLSFTLFTLSHFTGNMKQEISLIKYVINNSSAQDKLLNGNYSYNLFNPDTDYHWFGFFTTTIIADLYIDKNVNYNEQIKTYRPKFLFIPSSAIDRLAVSETRWLRDRNTALLQKATHGDKTALNKLSHINLDYWLIDTDYINKNYRYIGKYGVTELWQRIDN